MASLVLPGWVQSRSEQGSLSLDLTVDGVLGKLLGVTVTNTTGDPARIQINSSSFTVPTGSIALALTLTDTSMAQVRGGWRPLTLQA